MGKEKQEIMVVPRELLFGEDLFKGFRDYSDIDYEKRILKNFNFMERQKAENNPSFKQPIAYTVILNPSLKKVFLFQRSKKDKDYGEKRLQGKWSCGVGGHIERFDKGNNPISESMLRELKEEVELEITGQKILGYINYDDDDVGKVHFGILYIVETNSNEVKPKDSEISCGELKSIEEIEKIFSSDEFIVEDWSRISFEPLKKYLSSTNNG